jgi:dolichol-phosphate mannosyltransferase
VGWYFLGNPVRHELFQTDARVAVNDGPIELAIIIPTFNESANIVRMVESLALALAGIHWEAVFVDDNSPDGTAELVRSIAVDNSNVRIVHRIGRRGLSTAVIEGMLATAAPILAVIDGDMQHDEAILPALYAAVASGRADIAVGTRYGEGGSVGDWDESRVLGSRIATKIGQLVLKVPLSDPMSGFFLLSRETLMRAIPRISGVGFKILLDIVSSLPQTPRIAEVPYTFRTRELGESKASALVAAEYLSLLADKTIGRFIPLRLLSFLAVGGIGVGVHLGILGALLALGLAFLTAQIVAVMSAMSLNFFLNNIFTYHDRRLRGWRVLTGLISFYAVCSLGAVANIGIGAWANAQHNQWWVAGLAGVLIGAVWNFAASSFVTWRK